MKGYDIIKIGKRIFKEMKIYNKIFAGLLLGIVFGLLFPTKEGVLSISYKYEGEIISKQIKNWQNIAIKLKSDTLEKVYTPGQENILINYYNSLDLQRDTVIKVLYEGNKYETYSNILKLNKSKSIPSMLKPIGILFVRLLSFIAIPLVIASLFVGASSLGDVKKVARIGYKLLMYYLATTVIAISIGLLIANIIKPGIRIPEENKNKLIQENYLDVKKIEDKLEKWSLGDFIISIVPSNPFSAIANGEMLPIIFTSIFLGLMANLISKDRVKILQDIFNSLSDIMIQCVNVVMKLAPYAVFVLIGAVISEFGYSIVRTLIWYILTVVFGLCLQLLVIYPIFLKVFAKRSIKGFYIAMRPAMLVAFTTSSSAATLPVNMNCCEKGLNISRKITSFVLPLGTTINMDGTALYQGVATTFIAQIYGYKLLLSQQMSIVLTATLASIGTAPIPGLGIIMLIIILKSINIPEEGILFILGVDRLIDMCRTVVNISGDAVGAAIIEKSEGKKS